MDDITTFLVGGIVLLLFKKIYKKEKLEMFGGARTETDLTNLKPDTKINEPDMGLIIYDSTSPKKFSPMFENPLSAKKISPTNSVHLVAPGLIPAPNRTWKDKKYPDDKVFYMPNDFKPHFHGDAQHHMTKDGFEVDKAFLVSSKEFVEVENKKLKNYRENLKDFNNGMPNTAVETWIHWKIPYNEIESKIGAGKKTWDIFRDTIAGIESSGKYKVYGGNNDMYDGRYQMGKLAKMDGARIMNQKDPGHSDDPNKFMRVMFRNNKTMQERLFAGYTIANHNYLSSVKEYAEADALRKLQILAYAHNQGWQGAKTYVKEGTVGSDSFGTKGTDYTNAIKAAFESNNLTPQIKEVSSVQNTVKNIISKTQQIAQNIMSGDSINESSLKDVESNESSFQVVAGDLGPIDLSTEPINPPPIITGGGSPYVIPANAYVKPRFGLLADVASNPVEIS